MNEPTDTKQKDDDQIIGKAKALFDDSVDSLDAATLSNGHSRRGTACSHGDARA
jgi:hypothetical protein